MKLSKQRRAELMGASYIRVIIQHEEIIRDLYSAFASAFLWRKTFWTKLAEEEERHRKLAMMLEDKVMEGAWSFHRPDYMHSSIKDSIQWISSTISRLETKGMTMREALDAAVNIEHGMLEARYMDIIDDDVPEARRALDILKADTEEHLKRVEKEAKRFKWHLLARKVYKSTHHVEVKTPDSDAQLRKAQREILDCLVSLEESLSSLYRAYSDKIKDHSGFWDKFAAQELQHAKMLKGLYKYLDEKNIFMNLGQFNKEEMVQDIEALMDAEYDARHRGVSMDAALNVALKLETTLAESSFYKEVTSTAPEYQHVAARMNACLDEHVQRLKDKVMEVAQSKVDIANNPKEAREKR